MMTSPRESPPLKVITNYCGTCENVQRKTVSNKSATKRRIESEDSAEPDKKKVKDNENSQKGIISRISIEEDNTKREHSAAVEKSIEHDGSEINRLPSEILFNIFEFLPSHFRSNVRLVCKKWYDHCQNEKITIRRRRCNKNSLLDIGRRLANFQFKYLHLSFDGVPVNKFPVTLWSQIGSKVRSLECQLAVNTIKNIVLFCDNLQHMYLHVSPGHQDEASTLITTLETLVNHNAANRELNTLEMSITDEVMHLSDSTIEIWRRIFQAIYRLFPNVMTFSFSRCNFRYEDSVKYSCKFSREKCAVNQVEDSLLASIFADLAFSIFSQDNWVKSLDRTSALRLNNFELIFCKKTYTSEDEIHLRRFFANQRYLTSVCMDFSAWIDVEMLRSVLFEIVKNCLDLNKLSYLVPSCKRYLTPTEFSYLLQKMARVKTVSIGGFSMNRPPVISATPSSPTSEVSTLELSNIDENICSCFIRNYYSCLRHLTIRVSITDTVLQSIFEYSTDLIALDVHLHSSCTNFGITGRHPMSDSSVITCGYSISRLRNLQKLVINFEEADNVNDQVFLNFDFPKLRYLHCIKDLEGYEALVGMASKVPLLEEIKFLSKNMSLKDLISVCQPMKNLYHLHVDFNFFLYEIRTMFSTCPRLRLITDFGFNRVQYYPPDSKILL